MAKNISIFLIVIFVLAGIKGFFDREIRQAKEIAQEDLFGKIAEGEGSFKYDCLNHYMPALTTKERIGRLDKLNPDEEVKEILGKCIMEAYKSTELGLIGFYLTYDGEFFDKT